MSNYHEWKDMSCIDEYFDEFKNNTFVFSTPDGSENICFGAENVPDDSFRFICIPYDSNWGE